MQITVETPLSEEEVTWRLDQVKEGVKFIVRTNKGFILGVFPALATDVYVSGLKSVTARYYIMFLLLSVFLSFGSIWMAQAFEGHFHTAIKVFKSRRVDSGYGSIGFSIVLVFASALCFSVPPILLALAKAGSKGIAVLVVGTVVAVGILGFFLMVMVGKILLGCQGKTGIFAGLEEGRDPGLFFIARTVGAEIRRRLRQRRSNQDDLPPTHQTGAASSSSSSNTSNAGGSSSSSSSSNTSSRSCHVLSLSAHSSPCFKKKKKKAVSS